MYDEFFLMPKMYQIKLNCLNKILSKRKHIQVDFILIDAAY